METEQLNSLVSSLLHLEFVVLVVAYVSQPCNGVASFSIVDEAMQFAIGKKNELDLYPQFLTLSHCVGMFHW
jgi:hypothetical protein